MKVVFLDIDGVLNHLGAPKSGAIYTICPLCLQRLHRIVDETAAEIVVTSSWRFSDRSMEFLADSLGGVGLTIHDSTPILPCSPMRHAEIRQWMDGKDVERFAILDDSSDAFITDVESANFQTSWENGLTDEIADEVIRYMGK